MEGKRQEARGLAWNLEVDVRLNRSLIESISADTPDRRSITKDAAQNDCALHTKSPVVF